MNKNLRAHNCLIDLDYERKFIMCRPKEGRDVVLTVPALYAWHEYNLTTEQGIREWVVLEIAGWHKNEMILKLNAGYKIIFYGCENVYLYGVIVSESQGNNIFGFEKGLDIKLRGSPFYGNRKHVFLSHSSVDKDEVRKLAKDLERSADLFFDEKSIIPGQSITKSINDGLLGSDAIVLVLSKNSINSDWVLREYSYAIHVKKVIIPVLLHDCIIPPMLADIKYIKAYDQSIDVYDSVIKALDILVTEE